MRKQMTTGLLALTVLALSVTRHFWIPALPAPPAPRTVPSNVVVQARKVDEEPIRVYFPESREVRSMPLREYLTGVVAAEMGPDFAPEALKAQYVIARTYAVRRMELGRAGGCPLYAEADVCAAHEYGQAYLSKPRAVTRFGPATAERFWRDLERMARETAGEVLRFDGELIDPLYHSVSGTYTEESGAYFTEALPYLKPVADHWGADAPALRETRRLPLNEVAGKLSPPGKRLTAAAAKSMAVTARTAAGRVKTVKLGGTEWTGREVRERLGLRSTNFTLGVQGSELVVTTVGYGHGVGLSQYGAEGMARAGKGYREILTYYYQGTVVGPR